MFFVFIIPSTHTSGQNVYYYFEINQERDVIKANKLMRLSYFTFWTEKEWWNDLDRTEKDDYETTLTEINKTFIEVYRNRIKNLTTITHSNERQYSIPTIIMPLKEDVFYNIFKTGNSHTIILNSKKLKDKDFPLFLSMAFIEVKLNTIRTQNPNTEEELITKNIIKNALIATSQNEHTFKHSYNQFNQNLFQTKDWVTLFTYFIAENVNEKFFTILANSQKKGTEAIDDALKKAGSTQTFSSFFSQWSLASSTNKSLLKNKNDFNLYKNQFIDYEVFSGIETHTTNNQPNTIKIQPYSTSFIKYIPEQLGINKDTKNIMKIKIQSSRYPRTIHYVTNNINSNRTIHKHTINTGRDDPIEVNLFGTYIMSVMIIADNPSKTTRSLKIHEYQETTLSSGDLIKYKSDVFIIKDKFIRKIPSPEVFNAYGHLSWKDVKNIDAKNIEKYEESTLIKTIFSNRVFEIDKNNILHWLDMSPAQFEKSGRAWNQIFIVNEHEINWYKEGEKYTK